VIAPRPGVDSVKKQSRRGTRIHRAIAEAEDFTAALGKQIANLHLCDEKRNTCQGDEPEAESYKARNTV